MMRFLVPFLLLWIAGCASRGGMGGVESVLRRAERHHRHVAATDGAQSNGKFRWPLENDAGKLSSGFGPRNGRRHDGVDLRTPHGTAVIAVADGVVVYADDSLADYGVTVVVKHGSGLATVYAHNQEVLVKEGTQVHAGDHIALSGDSGNATGPHLHFEVRRGLVAIDPLPWLGIRQIASDGAGGAKAGAKKGRGRR